MQILVLLVAVAALMGTALTAVAEENIIEEFEIEAMENGLIGLKYDYTIALSSAVNSGNSVAVRRQWGLEVDRLRNEIVKLEVMMRETEAQFEKQERAKKSGNEFDVYRGGGVTYEKRPLGQSAEEERAYYERKQREAEKAHAAQQQRIAEYEAERAERAAANTNKVSIEQSYAWYGMLASINADGCQFPDPIVDILVQHGNYGGPVPAMLDQGELEERKQVWDALSADPAVNVTIRGHPNEFLMRCLIKVNIAMFAALPTNAGRPVGTSFDQGPFINLQTMLNRWGKQLERRY